ncbi:hypothetical protein [Deinococcus sp.]|uniref:hypothetical protein n=1 Tax=Deinococcus sp. TaxID=47478 RepID=UPI0028698881|nr:hypothetical protein [Deinococcus sp.]
MTGLLILGGIVLLVMAAVLVGLGIRQASRAHTAHRRSSGTGVKSASAWPDAALAGSTSEEHRHGSQGGHGTHGGHDHHQGVSHDSGGGWDGGSDAGGGDSGGSSGGDS